MFLYVSICKYLFIYVYMCVYMNMCVCIYLYIIWYGGEHEELSVRRWSKMCCYILCVWMQLHSETTPEPEEPVRTRGVSQNQRSQSEPEESVRTKGLSEPEESVRTRGASQNQRSQSEPEESVRTRGVTASSTCRCSCAAGRVNTVSDGEDQ